MRDRRRPLLSECRGRVPAQRVMRELELVALAHEEPKRPLAVPWRLRRLGEAAREQLARGVELVVPVVAGERLADVIPIDAQLGEPPLDPLGPPPVEIAPVLREPPGIAGV